MKTTKNVFGNVCPDYSNDLARANAKLLKFDIAGRTVTGFDLSQCDVSWLPCPIIEETKHDTVIIDRLVDDANAGCQECLIYLSKCYCPKKAA